MSNKKQILNILLIFSFLILSTNAHSKQKKHSYITHNYTRALANEFCEDKSYFRRCYFKNETDCLNHTHMATSRCKLKLPKKSKNLVEYAQHARNLGECVGNKIARKNKLKKESTKLCMDISAWE